MDATAHALYIKIDGVALKSPGQYFSGTGCFDLHDAASGQSGLAAGSGYWVFVPPLAKGAHELQFGGRFSADNFSQRITYNLDVQ